jgi:hypothetical protein
MIKKETFGPLSKPLLARYCMMPDHGQNFIFSFKKFIFLATVMGNKVALILKTLLSGKEKFNICRAYFISKLSAKIAASARKLEILIKHDTNGLRDLSRMNTEHGKPKGNKRSDLQKCC